MKHDTSNPKASEDFQEKGLKSTQGQGFWCAQAQLACYIYNRSNELKL